MPAAEVEWMPPVIVLGIGLIVGLLLYLNLRRSALAEKPASIVIDDRQRRFDSLIAQLRELQDGVETTAVADRESETMRLESEAARLLRELDLTASVDGTAPSATTGNRGFFAERPALRRLVWTTGIAVAGAVMYVILLQTTKPREADGTLTGNLPDRGINASASTADPAMASLLQRVESDPNDLNARNDLAKAYLERQDLMAVFQQTDFVLKKEPENARALAYQALVRLAIGEAEEARAMVTRAIASDPNLLDAWLHLAIIHLQSGNGEAAIQTLQLARQRHPEAATMLNEVEAEMKRRLAGASEPSVPLPSQPGQSEQSIAGEIRIARGSSAPPAGTILFVTVREAGSRLGAPLAALRLQTGTFPMRFSIGQEHSMQGRPFPESARIEARIDSDGDPLTKTASDLTASADEVKPGASNVILSLAPPASSP